jgi:ferritin-like metal-binding protein YciE
MIQTYLSDALARERHINQPLTRQLEMDDAAKFSEAATLISNLKTRAERHILDLEARLEQAVGRAAPPVKSAWTQLLGAGAAMVDGARKTRVSKNLRDDYTALALASESYTTLNATALGLGDDRTAKLAQKHLDDYAQIVVEISNALPSVVLQELALDGEVMRVWAAQIAEQNTEDVWK